MKKILIISLLALMACATTKKKDNYQKRQYKIKKHKYNKIIRELEIKACKRLLLQIDVSLEYYYQDHKKYPETLDVLTKTGRSINNRRYLSVFYLKDPWKQKWDYKRFYDKKIKMDNYYIRSIGPDGKRATADDINSENLGWPKGQ